MDLSTAKQLAAVSYDRKNTDLYPKGWVLDASLSNKNHSVLYNPESKQVSVSYRGTSKGKDLLSDAAILTGHKSLDPRFRNAKRIVNKTNKKYDDYKVYTTSHSLGASLAEYGVKNSKFKNTEVINFNKGASLSDIGSKRNKRQTDVRTKQDLVSFTSQFQRGGKLVTAKTKRGKKDPLAGHKLKNMFV